MPTRRVERDNNTQGASPSRVSGPVYERTAKMSGMPLLSGPPPPPHHSSRAEMSCRKCNKEFNIIFTRSRKCNHCGYSYCSSCADYQALLPRQGPDTGYDVVPVCAFCIENLTITAGGRSYLKGLPLARLKRYADAYNIKVDGVLEKDDLVQRIMSVRSQNGCLPQANEEFYRKRSVPTRQTARPRGLFSRTMDYARQPPEPAARSSHPPSGFARPDLDQSRTQQGSRFSSQSQRPRYAPPPGDPPHSPRPQYPQSNNAPPQPPRPDTAYPSSRPPGAGSTASSATPSRPASAAPHAAPQPPPTLDALLAMSDEDIARLSISTLKSVLFQNHVNARLLLEKGELVGRVKTLVDNERRERARDATIRAREEEEANARVEENRLRVEREAREREELERAQAESAASAGGAEAGEHVHPVVSAQTASPAPPASTPAPPVAPSSSALAALERDGLCVICQDEEANIAIVDCGHLAMCRACSELILSSTRECPLCRTRIVTEARLLRIFKT
ncbi:hypothetical protein EVG20_g2220 [Dentipellis fragilis]|uniref:RING-type domain-containing protein n=1 Tax=Dentipellis fragilis TaxID=205917 RepID=A0A4Y9ZBL5_9AGAM|nr:hypothetical protein EVG20_g2220 [Dentipellis fragilis]